jgi:hypothetical protein
MVRLVETLECQARVAYRITTTPEPNSSRLTTVKSTGFESVGPWPARPNTGILKVY